MKLKEQTARSRTSYMFSCLVCNNFELNNLAQNQVDRSNFISRVCLVLS